MPIGLGGLALGLNRRRRGFSPSLALNFLSQAIAGQYGTLDPRVSFSRASLATVTRSDGLVTWAGHNLILNSDDLTAASWSAANGTRTLVSDPTGQFGTVSQVAVPTTAFTFFTPSSNIGTNGPACFVMWVLGSASCTSLTAGLYDGASFGLLTGEIVSGPGTLTLQSSNTVAAITGLSTTAWTVVRISRTDAPTQVRPLIYPRSNSGANAGDVLFFRRFQLNLGTTPHPYYPTTGTAYNAPRFQFDPSGVTVTENYGANLVTNGTFDTNTTGWSAVAGATLASVGGQLEVANGSADFGYALQAVSVVAGRSYLVSTQGRVGTTSMMRLSIGTAAGSQNLGAISFTSSTTSTGSVFVTATTNQIFLSAINQTSTLGDTGYIDNVSVREYLGTVNPATPNLVTNGDFSNGSTGWTIDGSWTVANGVATKTAASSATIFQTSASITTGRSYIVEYTAAGATVDAIRINVRTPLDSIQTGYINQNGPVRVVFTSTATGAFGLFAFANNVSVDNISVREISTAESLYGPTLLTNGDFSSGLSSWSSVITGGTTISVVAGAVVFTGGNGATDFLLQPVNCTLNRVYRVQIVAPVGAQIRVVQNYSPFATVTTFDVTQAGGQTFYFVAPATGVHGIRIYRNTATSPATFDDVVVQEYLGDRQGSAATPLGLLVEEQRTNLLTWSEAFESAAWAKLNSTVTASAGVAPDGTPNARLLTATTTAEEVYVSTLSKTATAAAYTLSVYVKRDVTTEPFLIVLSDNVSGEAVGTFNLATQTATAVNGSWSAASAVMTSAGNGWFRCSLTATSPANTGLLPGFRWASSAGQTVLLWGAQLEAGAFLTTYIPTFGATATRAGDFPIIEGANFSAFYNQSAGTLFAEASVSSLGIARYIAQADDNGTANRHAFLVMESNLGRLFTANASAVQADITVAPTVTAGVPFRYAAAYALDSFAVSVGGTTPTQDLTGTPPTVDRLRVGTGIGGANLNGVLRRLDYYPTRLPNQQLQALTTV